MREWKNAYRRFVVVGGPVVRDNVMGLMGGVQMELEYETGRGEDSHDCWQALHASRASPALHASRALHATIYTWVGGAFNNSIKLRQSTWIS